ncbi:MAG: L,D-transpeptidase [Acidobacteria bacterium]|nr:L,D-transpeptidase [Acidobacteriota bacterium]
MTTNGGILFVLLAGACVAAGAACGARVTRTARAGVTNPAPTPLPATREEEEVNQRPLKLPLTDPRLVVEKGARRLKLYAGGELVRVRRVALGFEPAGDKVKQGDGRTPEGDYQICMKNERSNFYLSLGLTYPNAEDAERGLRDGIITKAQHKSITQALAAGRCPPWNTALGGEVFIHGGGTARDWTFGCVALENPEIKELFDALPKGTPVRIVP